MNAKSYKSLIVFFAILNLALANTCGGNCPSNRCNSCVCGTSKMYVDINSYCSQGSWSQSCCTCIVKNESGGNAHAELYNTNGSTDAGLF